MQYSIAAVLAFATAALAQTPGYHALTKPVSGEVIPAGTTYTLVWTPSTLPGLGGPVNLVLVGGASAQTLVPLSTVGSNIDAALGKYDWAVASNLGKDKAYGIKIELASDPTTYQWSNPFTISVASGGSDNSTSTTTSDSSTTTGASTTDGPTTTDDATTTKPTAKPTGNYTTSAPTKIVTSTSTSNGGNNGGSQTTSSRSSISTGAAATAFAGTFAVIGGVAMAAVLGM